MKRLLLCCVSILLMLVRASAEDRPNIIVILCDDLGYGDVGCFNDRGKIATPHIDRLARDGVRFTDAHSSSAVCTPTRYALLTGRYNWRSRLQRGVLGGMSPRLIEPGMTTVADLLQREGYVTACVGKWHLGLDWELRPEAKPFADSIEKGDEGWRVDFGKPFRNGPLALGFDTYFGISASLDMVPYTFLQDDRVTVEPDVDEAYPMMVGRHPNRTTRRGPAAESFDADQVLPALTDRAIALIRQWQSPPHAADGEAPPPFFLYLPFASPHTPIVPTAPWLGRSGLNPYADFVMQTDDAVGQILQVLDELQLTRNTLVVFTSDNGCSPQADFAELAQHNHHPSAEFRGHKADIFEGGHRVPFVARWPERLPANSTCEALIGLQDIMATCAEILQIRLPDATAVDSFSWLAQAGCRDVSPHLPRRESLVHHSINGSFAIRRGPWKLCFCPDSGGWSTPRPGPASRDLPPIQLFHIADDPGETSNLAADHPDVVQELTDAMQELVDNGRSTPGPLQTNAVSVSWKRTP